MATYREAKMRHWQNLNDEKPPRYWYHGRGWWGRWRIDIALPRRPRAEASLRVDTGERRTWTFHASLFGWGVWIGPGDSDSERREYGIAFHNGSLWWRWGADIMGWDSRTPKWRDCCFHVSEWILGSRTSEVAEILEEREIQIPMPEGCYPAKARLEMRVQRGRFRTRRWRCVNLDVVDTKGGIPHDGKGENSWDCGSDGTYGVYMHVDSIEQAIGNLIASSLRDRARYGNSFAERDGRMSQTRWASGVDR
jgi:hypothetical protein